ncbi:MAG TPA: siderophore ABC transporter substrate-binding protein [Firmicutes bacterium]|jgi:iron complex transport system substrate-binding protein|nr:siderophore ABC transporter substrate-binding protein [Bacillota bacterium]
MKRTNVTLVILLAVLLLTSAPAGAAPLVVEHPLGTVSLDRTPERVVVFDYGVLDALDVLGVEVVGVPASNLPPFLSKFSGPDYVNVGTLFEPDFEAIYALNPDLIIISTRQASQYEELSRIGPTLYVEIDNATWWGSVQSNLQLLGELFDLRTEVEGILAGLNERVSRICEQASESGLRTLIVMANDGALSVYGAESRFGIVHQDFGFAAADDAIDSATHGQNISFEYLVKVNPDVIFVVDRASVAGGSIGAEQVMSNPLVKVTKASQTNRVIYLQSQAWYVVSGGIRSTEMMMDDVEQLFR